MLGGARIRGRGGTDPKGDWGGPGFRVPQGAKAGLREGGPRGGACRACGETPMLGNQGVSREVCHPTPNRRGGTSGENKTGGPEITPPSWGRGDGGVGPFGVRVGIFFTGGSRFLGCGFRGPGKGKKPLWGRIGTGGAPLGRKAGPGVSYRQRTTGGNFGWRNRRHQQNGGQPKGRARGATG